MKLEGLTTRHASIAGAVIAAVLASSCCIGPLILAALGVGAAGAFTAIAGYRYPILAGAAVLLGLGSYLTYRAPRSVDACGCEKPRAKRGAHLALCLSAAVTVLLATAPNLLSKTLAHTDASAVDDVNTRRVVINVRGIDCEACAAPLRRALSKAGGLHALALNIPDQKVVLAYEPAPGRLEAYVAAINDLGYEASLAEERR